MITHGETKQEDKSIYMIDSETQYFKLPFGSLAQYNP